MIPQAITLLKDNKGVTVLVTALTAVVLLGGTGTISLPADEKVAQVQQEFKAFQLSQNSYHQQQSIRSFTHELQNVRWQIEDITREINRVRSIPSYTGHPSSMRDLDYVERLKGQRAYLQKREQQIMQVLQGGG